MHVASVTRHVEDLICHDSLYLQNWPTHHSHADGVIMVRDEAGNVYRLTVTLEEEAD